MTNSRKAQPLDFDVDGLEVDEGLGVRRRMVGGGSGNETNSQRSTTRRRFSSSLPICEKCA